MRTLRRGIDRIAFALAFLIFAAPVHADDSVTLNGTLTVGLSELSIADAGEIVVFLEAVGRQAVERNRVLSARPRPTASIRQRGARFEPDFLVVSQGQRVEMPNDDVIYHNVFSYSEPNDFDLGMYAAGELMAVQFEHSGLVRIYCSIHDEMDGLIFVAPSPLFSIPDASGRYVLEGVPPGPYRLHVWSERLPEVVVDLAVAPRTPLAVDLVLGGGAS